jgi:RNA recognition motif-containing protein
MNKGNQSNFLALLKEQNLFYQKSAFPVFSLSIEKRNSTIILISFVLERSTQTKVKMKFSREEETLLEKWMVQQLAAVHQNNAETLSKYILSLLKQDKDNMKQFCHDELRTFLKDRTEEFVSILFAALHGMRMWKSYLIVLFILFIDGSYKVSSLQDNEESADIERQNSTDSTPRHHQQLQTRRSPDRYDDDDRRRYNRRDSDGGDRSAHRDRREADDHHDRDKWRDRDSRDDGNRSNRGGGRDRDRDNRDRNNDNRRNNNNNNNNRRDNNNRFDRNDNNPKNNNVPWQHQQQQQPPNAFNPMPPMPPYPWNPAFMPPFPHHQMPPGMMFPGFPPYNPEQFGNHPPFPPPESVLPPNPNIGTEGDEAKTNNEESAASASNLGNTGEKPPSYEEGGPPVPPPPMMMGYPQMFMGYGNYMNPNMYNPGATEAPDNSNPNRRNNQNRNNNNNNNNPNNNNRGNRRNNNNESNKNQLPEAERCTLRCTGIPTYVTEDEIKHYFESFGHVVRLQVSPMEDHHQNKDDNKAEGEEGENKKKTYNECLIQFYSPQNAKRCLTSQLPILNNRYIRIFPSNFNILMPSDVDAPSYEMLEKDKSLLTGEIVPKPYEGPNSKKKSLSHAVHTVGVSNKWRRTSTDTKVAAGTDLTSASLDESIASVDVPSVQAENKEIVESTSQPKPENTELKQEFEQLKTLKQQAEDILKQKEKLLFVSPMFIYLTFKVNFFWCIFNFFY